MGNITKNQASTAQNKKLEWGNHNPRLTDLNFIDRVPKRQEGHQMTAKEKSTELSNDSIKI